MPAKEKTTNKSSGDLSFKAKPNNFVCVLVQCPINYFKTYKSILPAIAYPVKEKKNIALLFFNQKNGSLERLQIT